MSNNIVLVGMMGSGKTTIGSFLAKKLDFKFTDIDDIIEREEKKSINELFDLYGEGVFRNLETDAIKRFSKYKSQVISTGGGAILKHENIEALKENGILIYLKATPKELFERVKMDESRPLLQTPNPLKTLEEILKNRQEYYEMADITIDTEDKASFEIVNEIIEKARI